MTKRYLIAVDGSSSALFIGSIHEARAQFTDPIVLENEGDLVAFVDSQDGWKLYQLQQKGGPKC